MRNKITMFVFGAVCAFLMVSCSLDLKEKQVPFAVKLFINEHFPDETIDSMSVSLDKEYYVLLSSGVELEFNHRGIWSEISARKNDLPQSLNEELPEKMVSYIAENYPNSRVKKIEKTFPGSRAEGYRVRLSKANNIDLSFNRKGELAMKSASDIKLPALAQSFMDKYFADDEIAFIEKEHGRDYRVYLASGIQVYFGRKGACEEIVSKKKGLPEAILEVLPRQAVEYMQTNYPKAKLLRLAKKSYGFKVRLGKPSEVNLSFSRVGALVDDEFME